MSITFANSVFKNVARVSVLVVYRLDQKQARLFRQQLRYQRSFLSQFLHARIDLGSAELVDRQTLNNLPGGSIAANRE